MSISGHSRCAPVAQGSSTDLELRACIGGFNEFLAMRGYAASTIVLYARCIERFTQWLARRGAAVADLDDDAVMRDFLDTHASGSQFSKVNCCCRSNSAAICRDSIPVLGAVS